MELLKRVALSRSAAYHVYGLVFKGSEELLSFYSSGRLSSGYLVESQQWDLGDRTILLEGYPQKVMFFEDGHLLGGTLKEPALLPIAGREIEIDPWEFSLHPNGFLKMGYARQTEKFWLDGKLYPLSYKL